MQEPGDVGLRDGGEGLGVGQGRDSAAGLRGPAGPPLSPGWPGPVLHLFSAPPPTYILLRKLFCFLGDNPGPLFPSKAHG